MSTKFFNNEDGNTLFEKFKGIAEGMGANFYSFLAVAGYFRSSGYFKLREELKDVEEIKILVGINIDDIFRRHNKGLLFMTDDEKTSQAKEEYSSHFLEDIKNAKYAKEVEEGIIKMCDDLKTGRLQMKIHPTKNLHAKFYLCLPKAYSPNTDGWVIMGSSNLSDSGLGTTPAPRYELNVAMKDYDDVNYCKEEFDKLWDEAVALSADDIESNIGKTYIGTQPTPYEIYIKVLIDIFGDQVEDDFNPQLPDGVMDLKYQKDAVIQGYQMLLQHNGLFLADVVGLGKTLIATMIAKRFVEANGRNTSILVIYPPALERNWKETFKQFGILNKAQFITNGSLKKVLDGKDQYKSKEEFDLVIVDEAHGFRNNATGKYDELQKICKAVCCNPGLLGSTQKKVMLLSATPVNNRPGDLLNLMLLFQNSQSCTIDGISSLKSFFAPLTEEYNKLMHERDNRDVTREVDGIYRRIREELIDKVTIRRTRHNIMNNPDYKADLQAQNIKFPDILPPNGLEYKMDEDTSRRFYNALQVLTATEEDVEHIEYARYRAIEFLKPEFKERYKSADHISTMLAAIYRVHMVKRLESSFYAFKKSLKTLLSTTEGMIKMWNEDKIIIAPDINVKELMAKETELDEIIEYAGRKGFRPEDIVYKRNDFDPVFIDLLNNDREALERLCQDWEKEKDDPKFDIFIDRLNGEMTSTERNKTGKIVLFSESVDTLDYLHDRLKKTGRADVLMVSSANRDRMAETIRANFDANYDKQRQQDVYRILLTSDVLAEGINLHRSNVIVNYDSPWNATRLMQRIGRVNRIGSVASNIYNYTFYPSQQGDKEIQLYKNALIKLQGFHSAFGEDAQIFSHEEIVRQFEIFNSNVKDNTDKRLQLLREVRELYCTDRELYDKIKSLPMKCRVMRSTGRHTGESIVFVASEFKTEFYRVCGGRATAVDFLTAAERLKAEKEEEAVPFDRSRTPSPGTNEQMHYDHVNSALKEYKKTFQEVKDNENSILGKSLNKNEQKACKFLDEVTREITDNSSLKKATSLLKKYVEEGIYEKLIRQLCAMSNEYKHDKEKMRQDQAALKARLEQMLAVYKTETSDEKAKRLASGEPLVVISETFV